MTLDEQLQESVKRCVSESGNACYQKDRLCSLSQAFRDVPCAYLNTEVAGTLKLWSAATDGQARLENCYGCAYRKQIEE